MITYTVKDSPKFLFAQVLRGMARAPSKHRMPKAKIVQLAQELGILASSARYCAACEARFARAGSDAERWLTTLSNEMDY